MRENIRDSLIAIGILAAILFFPALTVVAIQAEINKMEKVEKIVKKEIIITIIKGDTTHKYYLNDCETTLKNFNKQ